ncbi:hypothetical protein [Streptomyces sp. NPDC090083]|uniref:hypothetical protein n=1 Tax=Streptomyces sp. NPDC090083 TaxID=3365941 RepID=UPI0037F3D2E4
MSRGEEDEADAPSTGDEHAGPEEPLDLSKPESAGEPPAPPARHAVVISGDGSAAIDGEPVPVAEGESVDAAILDRLQAYARDLDAHVTATISDPSAGYVAFVEVAPDGSSSLLEQQEEPQAQLEDREPSLAPAEAVGPGMAGLDGADAFDSGEDDDGDDDGEEDGEEDADEGLDQDLDDDLDEDEDLDESLDGGFDVEAYSREQQGRLTGPPPPPPPATPVVRLGPKAAAGSGRRQSDDEYKSPGLLHKPLVVGPVAIGVAALVIVPLVILGSSAPDKTERQKQTARSSSTTGSPLAEDTTSATSPPPSSLPSGTTASPSDGPKASGSAKAPKKGGGSGGTGGAGGPGGITVTVTAKPPRATVTAKPAQDTAATAVKRLHQNDPSGRHICYRAYLSGQGWQKPVCDGTLAGTTSGTHPIQALNIAVYGGDGSAANAFVHDAKSTNGQGKWEPQWTAVIGDGKNNYIGSTKSGAPYMTGFAINIGSGQICRSAKVHGYDWGSSDCTQPRPGYIFGGALENTRWLEAVKLWV